ncbi:MAG: SDR family NAD(P)-dependent oxidoreductase [Thermoleophilaceae bacterium]|nr:SDR family NAD(P)-dependent oxidoreductase [Thermoleophilaceae bacterium]
MSNRWTADEIPDQAGKVAIVTGANSGLGLITALELARHGAQVVVAARSAAKGEAAAAEIWAAAGGAKPEVLELDLGSLDSVRRFAGEFSGKRVDVLVNNAGVMMTPQQKTSDGFELQLGTNHLGHFALTGLLLDAVERSDAGRVVTVSSNEHKGGKLDFDNLHLDRGYSPRGSYQRSKLANAVFAIELDRRLRATGSPAVSVFAHPGYSATNLQSSGPTGVAKALMAVTNRVVAQRAARGALPSLYAATAPGLQGGDYYGPDGIGEMRGFPKQVKAIPEAYDTDTGLRLWEASEELTGVRYLPTAGRTVG